MLKRFFFSVYNLTQISAEAFTLKKLTARLRHIKLRDVRLIEFWYAFVLK